MTCFITVSLLYTYSNKIARARVLGEKDKEPLLLFTSPFSSTTTRLIIVVPDISKMETIQELGKELLIEVPHHELQ